METTQKFDHWCIVELFGHQKIAGHCTEQNIAGTNMLRVDVPETKAQPAFSKLYGASAIYAINPVDETTARIAVETLSIAPVTVWQGETFIKKFNEGKPSLPSSDPHRPSPEHGPGNEDDDDWDYEDDDADIGID